MKKIVMVMCFLLMGLGSFGCGKEDSQQTAATDNTPQATAKTRYVTIGTGGITGVYYPAGGAITKIVNKKRDLYNIRCTVEATGGSVFNVNALMAGDLDFGIVQSDRQFEATKGLVEWEGKPQTELRAVFSIHPESVTLVAAEDAGIRLISDLKGKRINIGNLGSGIRQNAIDALYAVGINYESDLDAQSVKAADAPSLLQDGRIDAFFYTVGHPSSAIQEATVGARKVRFVTITGINDMLVKNPYYAKSFIPVALYPGAANHTNVATFGVKATFVTSAKVPDEVVYAVTKEIFDNLEDFKKMHDAFQVLTKEGMLEGMSAPIHPGAMKYFKEAGMF